MTIGKLLVILMLIGGGVYGGVTYANGDLPNPLAQNEPQTAEAASALLNKAIGRASSGDYAGIWDLLVPEERALISRADYVTFESQCNGPATHFPYEVTDVRLENPTTALAVVKVMGFAVDYRAHYRDGHWLVSMREENKAGATYWLTHGHTCKSAA